MAAFPRVLITIIAVSLGVAPLVNSLCSNTFDSSSPSSQSRTCATFHLDPHCGGAWVRALDGDAKALNNFANEVSSIKVNPGCSLQACYNWDFSGCTQFHGGPSGQSFPILSNNYDNNIESYKCTCLPSSGSEPTVSSPRPTAIVTHPALRSMRVAPGPIDHDNSSESAEATPQPIDATPTPLRRLHIGRPPPPIIPDSNDTSTCAVLTTGFMRSSAATSIVWLRAETVERTGYIKLRHRYVYATTSFKCSLYYCSRPHFGGVCHSLGSLEHMISLIRFKVGSYVCDCE